MKFATLSIMDHHPHLGRSVPAFYKEVLAQIEAAEALGFHSVWFAEHHFSNYGSCPAPPVLLATAAQRTRRIRRRRSRPVHSLDQTARAVGSASVPGDHELWGSPARTGDALDGTSGARGHASVRHFSPSRGPGGSELST
jgi:hypothetical protein